MSVAPSSSIARTAAPKDVRAFVNHYKELLQYGAHQTLLFNDSDLQRELMQGIAPTFFHDANLLIVRHVILQACALTDPASTTICGVVHYNLTTEFFAKHSDFSAVPAEGKSLQKYAARLQAFRNKLLLARNKRLGHLDLGFASSRKSLGRASPAAWRRFWADLHEFVTLLQKRYLPPRQREDLKNIARLSDADDLVRALRNSSFFRAAIKDHSITLRLVEIARASRYFAV